MKRKCHLMISIKQKENLIDEEFFEITFDNKAIPYEENQKRRNINKLRKEAERIKIE